MVVNPRIDVGNLRFGDLGNADDTVVLAPSALDGTNCLASFADSCTMLVFHVSWKKTNIKNICPDSRLHPYLSVETPWRQLMTIYFYIQCNLNWFIGQYIISIVFSEGYIWKNKTTLLKMKTYKLCQCYYASQRQRQPSLPIWNR